MSEHTFLWHDYETFGANTRVARPAQFAAIRTDAELNEIGDPIMWYCQPANDFLPDPLSCLITGITPQHCLEHGIPEYQFADQINQEFSKPGTIGVGYNTIRFDDEITRFMLWRNLIDPYAREWQNQCGRWDIIDMIRTTYALRPEGIVWPKNDEGKISFRLEHLTAANGINHEAAHDALSDVRATIAMARLIRKNHPRLFDFCLSLRKKEKVIEEIGSAGQKPFLHVTGMIPVEQGCLCVAWPVGNHPTNKNEVIVWNLQYDPRELIGLDADEVRTRLFSKADALPEGLIRLPVKSIHLNKSPMVIGNLKTLSPELAARWKIDLALIAKHVEYASQLPDLSGLWEAVYQRPLAETSADVDQDLYNGFIGNADRRRLQSLICNPLESVATARPVFEDTRLDELFFRFKARNFPQFLSEDERNSWENWRVRKLLQGEAGAQSVQAYFEQIDALSEHADDDAQIILSDLYDYAEQIMPVQ